MSIHPSVTIERVIKAVARYDTVLDNPGFCINCGKEAEGVEPDAREYTCGHCGLRSVYGVKELIFMVP